MKEIIGKVVLDYMHYSGDDLYSDGEVEDEILDIVKKYSVSEYDNIIMQKSSWPIFYHLSTLRTNIINWIPLKKDTSVLEIGSGCGAITGILSEKCGEVTCIELSKKRSVINAYRNRDKENIKILVGNFQDVESSLNEKYDYITLIGVFEYSANYIHSDNPFIDLLKTVDKHLKKNGIVIIAIENKLGMKYWAGCKEDHVGKYYEGIEGYNSSDGVRTFSKKEIEDIIKSAGFYNYEFYYPYPDYKFPEAIYSDDFLPKVGTLYNNIRNYDMDRLITFDESKAFDTIIESGLFPIYSNSYLLLLMNSEE